MKRPAFTLIELLVVIAIIALLVSILLPSLKTARDLARDAVCKTHLHSLHLGFLYYIEDHEDTFPYGGGQGEYWMRWWHRVGKIPIDPWWASEQPPDSPLLKIWRGGYVTWQRDKEKPDYFKCPTAFAQIHPMWHPQVAHYDLNKNMGTRPDWSPPRLVRMSRIETQPVMLGDGYLYYYPVVQGLYFAGTFNELSCRPWPLQTIANYWGNQYPVDFYGHAGGTANFIFLDGHVEAWTNLKKDDLALE